VKIVDCGTADAAATRRRKKPGTRTKINRAETLDVVDHAYPVASDRLLPIYVELATAAGVEHTSRRPAVADVDNRVSEE
jgi:hypothetical protein